VASRKELKEQRRREREAAERAAEQAERRRRRRRLIGGGLALLATAAAAATLIVAAGGDDDAAPFAAKPDGMGERVQSAGLMPGGDHFHPTVKVFAAGKEIPIPEDLGISSDGTNVGVHLHPGDEKVHAEGVQAGTFTLGQLMAIWGVPFGSDRLGPYRADARREVTVFVKEPGEKRFDESAEVENLQLRDAQQVYVAYGTPQESPIVQ
jgi:hypothetical protein